MLNAPDATATRPYLLRALHEWCTDNGYTPYVVVVVDETVQVPLEFVKNGEIVLNVSYDATAGMTLGNDYIEFKARFGGVPREIIVPVNRVMAIYARENGQGMSFPMLQNTPSQSFSAVQLNETRPVLSAVETAPTHKNSDDEPATTPPSASGRPTLTRIK